MTILTIISRVNPWKRWHAIRTVIYLVLALGVGLVAILYYHPAKAETYLFSPWVLPTITLVWVVVLVLTHIHNPPPLFFRQSATSARDPDQHHYGQVITVPLADRTGNIVRKPVGGGGPGVVEWDLGMHQQQQSSYFGQTGYEGLGFSQYAEQQSGYAGDTWAGHHASPQGTAYDSYPSSTEFRHAYG